jgi:hypothetical protein
MSTLQVANISDGTDTLATGYVVNGSAKAWVEYNQSGTVAIVSSFNVASLTDVLTGRTSTNLTNSMASSSYALGGMCRANGYIALRAGKSASSAEVETISADYDEVGLTFTGDLA